MGTEYSLAVTRESLVYGSAGVNSRATLGETIGETDGTRSTTLSLPANGVERSVDVVIATPGSNFPTAAINLTISFGKNGDPGDSSVAYAVKQIPIPLVASQTERHTIPIPVDADQLIVTADYTGVASKTYSIHASLRYAVLTATTI